MRAAVPTAAVQTGAIPSRAAARRGSPRGRQTPRAMTTRPERAIAGAVAGAGPRGSRYRPDRTRGCRLPTRVCTPVPGQEALRRVAPDRGVALDDDGVGTRPQEQPFEPR